jgi:hypothetical protein
MGSCNRLKLGLSGANCSSGRAVTMVPERWSGSWPGGTVNLSVQVSRIQLTGKLHCEFNANPC